VINVINYLFRSPLLEKIADHMPPQAVVKQMNSRWHRKLLGVSVKQRFYPQCVTCSGIQGSILSKASRDLQKVSTIGKALGKVPNLSKSGGGINAYIHGVQWRREILAGSLVAACTVANSNGREISDGNQRRFEAWQHCVEKKVNATFKYLKNQLQL